jgi:hypothetical protein
MEGQPMAKWIQIEDAGNQVDSRKTTVKTGEINDDTTVQLMATTYRTYAVSDVKELFDFVAMGVSKVFPIYKSTRYDFRFFISHQGKHEFVLSIEIKKKWLTLSFRYDSFGVSYSQIEKVFPKKVTDPYYPGKGAKTRIKNFSEANELLSLLQKFCV